jgi:hypothetical protein
VLVLAAASLACAQSPNAASSGAQALLSSGELNGALIATEGAADGQAVREILDPHSGDRWILLRNDQCPGGPGRLVRVAADRQALGPAPLRAAIDGEAIRPLPVIRAGDRLTVEEHTAHVDAALEARALGTAAAGAFFEARLAIGGRVVRVVALGPGRAALEPETEARQ